MRSHTRKAARCGAVFASVAVTTPAAAHADAAVNTSTGSVALVGGLGAVVFFRRRRRAP